MEAVRDDDNGPFSGSAYVFGRDVDGPDKWGQVTKLTASLTAAPPALSSSNRKW